MPSEFELIRRFFTHASPGALLGVGDDAALVRGRPGYDLAISTDMLVAGRHFFPRADPALLGHKALAVNLSDMAAMGAVPRWVTLSLALPRADARWLRSFSQGFMRLARRHRVDLVGGDTTRGPLNICVQIVGEVPRGRALRRDGARAADDVWVSGTLGDAAYALAALEGRARVTPRERALLARRLHAPGPRVELGISLRGIAASAIDVSDGLLADLGHICERSRVGAIVEWERIPVSRTLARYLADPVAGRAVLAGGDDYELCFTARRSQRNRVEQAARQAKVSVTRIGHIVAGGIHRVRVTDGPARAVALAQRGYDHFG